MNTRVNYRLDNGEMDGKGNLNRKLSVDLMHRKRKIENVSMVQPVTIKPLNKPEFINLLDDENINHVTNENTTFHNLVSPIDQYTEVNSLKKSTQKVSKRAVRKRAIDLTKIGGSYSIGLNDESENEGSSHIQPIKRDPFVQTILIYFNDETCQVKWVNYVDEENLPNWKYVSQSIIFDKRIQDFVNLAASIKSECQCGDRCWSSQECGCSLLNLFINKDFSYSYNVSDYNCLPQRAIGSPLLPIFRKEYNKTLIKTFLSHHHIFECSSNCSCNKRFCHLSLTNSSQYKICHQEFIKNFVVQRIRKSRLVNNRMVSRVMWGLFTKVNIPKGSFVMDYCGEIISNKEAEKRGKVYDSEATSYLFDISSDVDEKFMQSYKTFCKKMNIDYHVLERNMRLNPKDDFPLVIDAMEYGNLARFINHSCNPNLRSVNVHQECNDPRYANISLFALKDIMAGTELTIDYHYESFEEAEDVYCLCLEKGCRNFLYSSK